MSDLAYRRSGAGDWLMTMGPDHAPAILFLPPLFEEMNRTRALLAATMRLLADRDFRSFLIDLPGTGESERELEAVRWQDWRAAVAAARDEIAPGVVATIRGGCLFGEGAQWRFAPVAGASLRRDLARAALTGGADHAGYPASAALLADLDAAEPGVGDAVRIVRLSSDPADADAKLDGPALWRRSEPGSSAELARAMADDLAGWVTRCAGS